MAYSSPGFVPNDFSVACTHASQRTIAEIFAAIAPEQVALVNDTCRVLAGHGFIVVPNRFAIFERDHSPANVVGRRDKKSVVKDQRGCGIDGWTSLTKFLVQQYGSRRNVYHLELEF